MHKYLVEFLGTFFLVLTIGVAGVLGTAGAAAPLAIGAALMIMIYAGAVLSGAHYNPAVTLAIRLRGRVSAGDVAPYIGAQLLAAVLAAALIKGVFAPAVPAVPLKAFTFPSPSAAALSEFLFSFALVHVILHVGTSKRLEGNEFYGLAIALTVVAGSFTVGSLSLASFNPAVSMALLVLGVLPAGEAWAHFVPQLLAAVLAALTFAVLNPDDP
ncbi:MAG: aquaporin [Myxococcales bacterium]|nr:aquaporin [Myxococcales bacterium]